MSPGRISVRPAATLPPHCEAESVLRPPAGVSAAAAPAHRSNPTTPTSSSAGGIEIPYGQTQRGCSRSSPGEPTAGALMVGGLSNRDPTHRGRSKSLSFGNGNRIHERNLRVGVRSASQPAPPRYGPPSNSAAPASRTPCHAAFCATTTGSSATTLRNRSRIWASNKCRRRHGHPGNGSPSTKSCCTGM